jgi:hypothetical protein
MRYNLTIIMTDREVKQRLKAREFGEGNISKD